ncbi:FtsX-like permease family protein [Brevibacillus fluminis]|uniref:FtsX-like permease family protein n=1 Tax=Brevibacillus fluminis TaxID=511487 RepID=UPI003F8ABB0F
MQYEKIKQMDGVKVAAPIAVLGYINTLVTVGEEKLPFMDQPGVYRVTREQFDNSKGDGKPIRTMRYYGTIGEWYNSAPSNQNPYQAYPLDPKFSFVDGVSQLVIGIDPSAENQLVGLEQAVLSLGSSRYFTRADRPLSSVMETPAGNYTSTAIPLLLSEDAGIDVTHKVTIERLPFPFADKSQAKQTMELVKKNGGEQFLDQQEQGTQTVFSATFTSKDTNRVIVGALSGIDPDTNSAFERKKNERVELSDALFKPGKLQVSITDSPYSERWPYAFQANPLPIHLSDKIKNISGAFGSETFQDLHYDDTFKRLLNPVFVGFYDPKKLQTAKNPGGDWPLETYGTSTARMVLDPRNLPVNPPVRLRSTGNPLSMLPTASVALTTLEAAKAYNGEQAISAIRIRVVEGDGGYQERIGKISELAKRIESETGLVADVTVGSVPQPVLIHTPANTSNSPVGWIEQFWMHLGGAVPLLGEIEIGTSGVYLFVFLLVFTYVLTTNTVTFLSRTREFGVLLATGWRQSDLRKLLFIEALLMGGFVAVISWAIAGAALVQSNTRIPVLLYLSIGLTGWFTYLVGTIPSISMLRSISPYTLVTTGEVQQGGPRIGQEVTNTFALAYNQLWRCWRRNLLSVIAMAIPLGLLVFYVFVTFRLDGVLYASWFGKYVAVEIGQTPYIAMVLCFGMAILITAEMMWQNVADRKQDLTLLVALGWPRNALRRLILWEGIQCGALSALLGVGIGFVMIVCLYRTFPWKDLAILATLGAISVVTGAVGALIPAEKAVRLYPQQGLRRTTTRKSTENALRIAIASFVAIALVGAATSGVYLFQADDQHGPTVGDSFPAANRSNPFHNQAQLAAFEPQPVSEGSHATYDWSIDMDDKGHFRSNLTVTAENRSSDEWDQLVFYFIPNVFNKEGKGTWRKGKAEINSIMLHGKTLAYTVSDDTLQVHLPEVMHPGDKVSITIRYQFDVPQKGLRYTQEEEGYYLAQAYPMLATYHQGWKKKEYMSFSESYNTGFSDFTVSFRIPDGYSVFSSSDQDPAGNVKTGTVTVNRSREMFIAILKNVEVMTAKVGEVEVRVIGKKGQRQEMQLAMETAGQALPFFEERIGKYANNQLDLVLGGIAMEYPGIVTVGSDQPANRIRDFQETVVHELAHQWFYGVVANDPYTDGWLDEGIVTLATSMYFYDAMADNSSFVRWAEKVPLAKGKASNLPLDQYQETKVLGPLYAQPAVRLWDLLSLYGDIDEGWRFLKAYFETYAYKQVDTDEFLRFVTAYFPVEKKYFASWLQVKE